MTTLEGTLLGSLVWGGLAAGSLLLGAVLGCWRSWSDRLVGLVLGFGAGALIASVSFELAEEGLRLGGALPVALGLAAGALVYFVSDRLVERRGGTASAGMPLVLGAFLDGVPEQVVLGIGLASGAGVSVALVVAIFVSNLPEGLGAVADMRAAGRSRASTLTIWLAVVVLCTAATAGGFLLAHAVGGAMQAAVNGFAAGALLVMLTDAMIPEARQRAGDPTGLATVVGFALAAGLSLL